MDTIKTVLENARVTFLRDLEDEERDLQKAQHGVSTATARIEELKGRLADVEEALANR